MLGTLIYVYTSRFFELKASAVRTCAIEEHRNTARLEDGSFRRCHYCARCVVVLAACCRGQQNRSDGGAWWWCWNEVVSLHDTKVVLRFFLPLHCCQLIPFGCLFAVLSTPSPVRYMLPRLYCAIAYPCLAASLYHFIACLFVVFCQYIPRNLSSMTPMLCCAFACPCSAAFLYHVTASSQSCLTPSPLAYW